MVLVLEDGIPGRGERCQSLAVLSPLPVHKITSVLEFRLLYMVGGREGSMYHLINVSLVSKVLEFSFPDFSNAQGSKLIPLHSPHLQLRVLTSFLLHKAFHLCLAYASLFPVVR